jgi:carotenoid 1,2-hydratase
MTERVGSHASRDATMFNIGPSQLEWRHDQLHISLKELSLPWLQSVQGKIVLSPRGLSNRVWPLSESGDHWWGPISTHCDIEVVLDSPKLRWRGDAYWDFNEGRKPVNDKGCEYASWDWTRATFNDGSSQVIYDVRDTSGNEMNALVLDFDQYSQSTQVIQPLPDSLRYCALPRTGWHVKRRAPVQAGHEAKVLHTLEDTPFYCRDVVGTVLNNQPVVAMHETLDVKRLASTVVQGMLPFKMPRAFF